MSLQLQNTLSGKKEFFKPVNPDHVRIYACGPTVYNFAHIGNARMAPNCHRRGRKTSKR